jgi:hypothetical protein
VAQKKVIKAIRKKTAPKRLVPVIQIDPDLTKQIQAAKAKPAAPVEAVIALQPRKGDGITVPSAEMAAVVAGLMKKVGAKSGKAPQRQTVFKNMGSFFVAADPEFVEELIAQPEVKSAVANKR